MKLEPVRARLTRADFYRPQRLMLWLTRLARLGLPVLLWLAVYFNLVLVAYGLVFLAKWRVLATKSYWWWIRFRLNFVDLVAGLAFVSFLNYATGNWQVQLIWVLIFCLWQVGLKPLSSAWGKISQGLLAQAWAVGALFYYGQYSVEPANYFLIIGAIWLVSYFCARHSVGALPKSAVRACWPIVWGLFSAQLAVVLLHWQLWIWFIPQFVFIQLVLNLPIIAGYQLAAGGRLSKDLKLQLIAGSSLLVLALLVLVDWQSRII